MALSILLLALTALHLPLGGGTFFPSTPSIECVNITRFMNTTMYIWTVNGTLKAAQPSAAHNPYVLCKVDKSSNTTVRDTYFNRNYTVLKERLSENLYGEFLDPEEGPTTMLISRQEERSPFLMETLVHQAPNYSCGIFYTAIFPSGYLQRLISAPSGNRSNSVNRTTLLSRGFGYSLCEQRVVGSSDGPYPNTQCESAFMNYCGNTSIQQIYTPDCRLLLSSEATGVPLFWWFLFSSTLRNLNNGFLLHAFIESEVRLFGKLEPGNF